MTDLTKLEVSLTKHGAHKISLLLRNFDKDEVLNHLWGSQPGINIERAQAVKNLSVSRLSNRRDGVVPELWNEARQQGADTIDALVLVSIIFK